MGGGKEGGREVKPFFCWIFFVRTHKISMADQCPQVIMMLLLFLPRCCSKVVVVVVELVVGLDVPR